MAIKESGPRLGRGLAALLGDTPLPSPSSEGAPIRTLPVADIEPGPFQPRREMAPQAFAELVESIRLRGVLQPILVRPHPDRPGRYQIVAGERRWRASQAASRHEIPVLLRELTDSDAMAAALVENLQREDLNAIEEAEGYRRLTDEFGLTQEQLGEAIGKSRSHVANAMRLLQLPTVIQAELQKGGITAGHARALLTHPDPVAAMRTVIGRGLNVRQTEALSQRETSRRLSGATSGAPARKDPETAALERDLSARLGLRVRVSFDGRGGSVQIQYQTLDQLDGLIALLNRD